MSFEYKDNLLYRDGILFTGHQKLNNGAYIYDGEWKDGKRCGHAIEDYNHDGFVYTYIGGFKNNVFHGYSEIKTMVVMELPTPIYGDFKGEYKNGLKDGWGEELIDDNVKSIGYWIENEQVNTIKTFKHLNTQWKGEINHYTFDGVEGVYTDITDEYKEYSKHLQKDIPELLNEIMFRDYDLLDLCKDVCEWLGPWDRWI